MSVRGGAGNELCLGVSVNHPGRQVLQAKEYTVLVFENVIKWYCILSLPTGKCNSTFPDFVAGLTPENRGGKEMERRKAHIISSARNPNL